MPPKKPLKLVTEKDRARKVLSVSEAASRGVRRDLLIALRSRIAAGVDDRRTPPRDLAALSRRLLEIVRGARGDRRQGQRRPIAAAASTPDETWS